MQRRSRPALPMKSKRQRSVTNLDTGIRFFFYFSSILRHPNPALAPHGDATTAPRTPTRRGSGDSLRADLAFLNPIAPRWPIHREQIRCSRVPACSVHSADKAHRRRVDQRRFCIQQELVADVGVNDPPKDDRLLGTERDNTMQHAFQRDRTLRNPRRRDLDRSRRREPSKFQLTDASRSVDARDVHRSG